MPVNYLAVIADLQEKRAAIDSCIQTLLSWSTPVQVETEPVGTWEMKAKYSPTKRGPLVRKQKPEPVEADDDSDEPEPKPEMGTREAVLRAVSEGDRTAPELADRVQVLCPSMPRMNVSQMIHYLQRTGVLHKDDQLKLRLVKDGKIQGV